MKRSLIGIAFLGLAFVSCKKDYTCICTQIYTEPAYEDNNGEYHAEYVYYSTISNTIKSKPKEAESDCNKGESINSTPSFKQGQGPYTTVVTCEIP